MSIWKKTTYFIGVLLFAALINYAVAMPLKALLTEKLTLGEQIGYMWTVLLLGITTGGLSSYIDKDQLSVVHKQLIHCGVLSSFLGSLFSILGFGLAFSTLNQSIGLKSIISVIAHTGLTAMFIGIAVLMIEGTIMLVRLIIGLLKN